MWAQQAIILLSLTVVQNNQQGSQQVAHALDVTRVQMLPHITTKAKIWHLLDLAAHMTPSWAKCSLPAHDVPQLLQVFRREVPVLSVTASDVFVDAMQIDQVHVQGLLLQKEFGHLMMTMQRSVFVLHV